MKKTGYILTSILIVFISFVVLFKSNDSLANDTLNKKSALYVWSITDIDYSFLDKIVDYLDLDTLYVGSYGDFESYKHSLIFNFAKDKDLKSYIVYGENYEDQEQILVEIKDLIDDISEFNTKSEYKIEGISVDSEFHSTSAYKNADLDGRIDIFSKYVQIMKDAYIYAQSKGIKLVSCIPSNYDSNISVSILEELIKDGCDYIQVMNYTKRNSVENIAKEVELAQKYNKKIESMAELQKPGENDVTDNITFWNDGIDACTSKFIEINDAYEYDNLSFTYHSYSSLVELSSSVIQFANVYDLELHTKDNDGNNLLVNDVYLVNDNEKIKGMSVYNKTIEEYVVYFYGIKYDEKYKVLVDNEILQAEDKEILFMQSSDRRKIEECEFDNYIPNDDENSDIPNIDEANKEKTPLEENNPFEDPAIDDDLNIPSNDLGNSEITQQEVINGVGNINLDVAKPVLNVSSPVTIVSEPPKEIVIIDNFSNNNSNPSVDKEEIKEQSSNKSDKKVSINDRVKKKETKKEVKKNLNGKKVLGGLIILLICILIVSHIFKNNK